MLRNTQIDKLKKEKFDITVIGGGASGAGIALDAATRGLKVALIEREDFSSETSSRSTKLIHGGVRYLEAAFKHLDKSQFSFVYEALHERGIMISQAPYLSSVLPIVIPVYSELEKLYFFSGLKIYEWMAGKRRLLPTKLLSKFEVIKYFPLLKEHNLKGGVSYCDGIFDDARMNLMAILTAIENGAVASNYIEAKELVKRRGRIIGVKVQDVINKEEWIIESEVVVSATGPFTDSILKMDDPNTGSMIEPALGTHLVLEPIYAPPNMGLLIPKTEDGRLLFVLPWQEHVILGTTDVKTTPEFHPKVPEKDVDYLLEHMNRYYRKTPTNLEIKSKWAGIRPLAKEDFFDSTANIPREHVIKITPSGLVVIAGGKWTSYRKMAEDVVDEMVKFFSLIPKSKCITKTIKLIGAKDYKFEIIEELQNTYNLEKSLSKHLIHTYGDQAFEVAKIAKEEGYAENMVDGYPYIEAEIVWAVRNEMAQTIVDILSRRMRLAFLNQSAAVSAIDHVVNILKKLPEFENVDIENLKNEARYRFENEI